MIRVVQTHTVGFEGPFLSRLGTLLPDPTLPREAGLPKPDSDPAPDSLGIGLSPNSSQKYTVLYLELIRSLLDPFQVSHTIIETSDSFRLPLTHSELPLTWGYHPECSKKYTVLYLGQIRSLLDPFQLSLTIIGTSDDREGYRGQYPPLRLYLGPDGRLALHTGYQSS